MKKIRGRIHYFGKWGGWSTASWPASRATGGRGPSSVQGSADDHHAGRTPRGIGDALTVADLCNRFLTAKLRKVESGELGSRMFADYKEVTTLLVNTFGRNRLVDDLAADDFEQLRAAMAKKWGPVRLGNAVTRVKSVFKYGTDNGLIERAVRFGTEFKKPDKAVLRRHRAKVGEKMLEAGGYPAADRRRTGAAEGHDPARGSTAGSGTTTSPRSRRVPWTSGGAG
jgi:hypothetical protein